MCESIVERPSNVCAFKRKAFLPTPEPKLEAINVFKTMIFFPVYVPSVNKKAIIKLLL